MLTVEEHLDYYARLKGIPDNKRKALIEKEI
jgi:ABC-type multidrug transport system ATPase subunit